jgi:hypothetical protein
MDPRPFRSPACKLLIVSYGVPGESRTPDLLIRIQSLAVLQGAA